MVRNSHRRRFLEQSLIGGTGLTVAGCLTTPWLRATAAQAGNQDRVLVVIQLSGGNDGLNTVVPFRDDAYYRARPKLAIAADSVVKLSDDIGLNPVVRNLETSLSEGRFSIVQGVGYQQPNRSHFESMDIWHSCFRKDQRSGQGWLGRWLGTQRGLSQSGPLGLHLGHEQQPLALSGRDAQVPSIGSLKQFRLQLGDREALKLEVMRLAQGPVHSEVPSPLKDDGKADDLLQFVQASAQTALEASQRLESAVSADGDRSEFPDSPLGEKLHIVSQLIVGQLPTRVYYVTLDGFDTHALQSATHTALLRQWSDALAAFLKRMVDRGHADRVLVMTFSEFGRRVAENASEGTDHGAAAPLFLAGPKLKQPISGAHPSLTDLDDGDLKFHTDFRCLYATIIERWFKGSSQNILGGQYQPLDLL